MNQAVDTQEDENKKGDSNRETFKQALSRKIFQIYFVLMRERNIDFIIASIMIVIHFIQIYGLLYNRKIGFPFQDDLYDSICSICDIIRVYPLMESNNGENAIYYWTISFALIAALILYFLQIIYIDYSIKIDKFHFILPIKILRYASTLIYWILMMPIIDIFTGIFSCDNGVHAVDNTLTCWSGIHIFYCILFSISLLGYFSIFFLVSFFYNESRPYHTDAFSRLDTNFETYISVYKILITIISHFLYQPKLHWLIIVIHILGSLCFCKMYLQYLPYYNKRTSILFGSGWFIYLWLSLNVLLVKALETVNYSGQSIVIIVGLVLIFPATKQVRETKINNKIFQKKHDKIKSEYELDIFIHKIYKLIIDQHVNEVDEMILLGIVHNHQTECLNSDCPLNNVDELYLPLTDSVSDRQTIFSKDPILLYHLINSIYAEYAKSSNSTSVLHSTYAYFLFYQIGNIHTALLELNVAEKCDTNFQQKFTIYRTKRFIENQLVNKFGKHKESHGNQTFAELDVTIVITFESLFVRLNREIEKSANDHIEFWSHLDSQMVDLNVLHKLGLNIISNTKRINDIWYQLTKINSNYPKALQIYGNYLVQIKNDNNEGEEFLNQASAMARPRSLDEHVNDFELMFAEDTAIVVISGNKDSQAKIMKTNNGITKLFGYNTFEVHGHEVNILMPPIIGVKHNYFLEQFFKTGKERVINSDLSTFAMLRAGHIFSITLIVKPVPSLRNDIQYIGLIKPTGKDYDYILTDQYGRIDSISKGITSMLQLQPSFFKENEIFIQILCPQLCETEKIRSTKEISTKFDIWQGVKDLSFIVPKNFSNLSQKTGGRGGISAGPEMNKSGADYQEELEQDNNGRRGGDQTFVGLKSPDHLKKVCNMFRNSDFKNQPQKYMQTLKNNINYDNPEIYRGPVKTEIINKSHGSGHLQLKVFKILNPKKSGTSADSDSARGVNSNQINKNVKALLDDTSRKLGTIMAEELNKRIQQMKLAVDQIKRGIRHPSIKAKPSNIVTPGAYENAEIQKYSKEIRVLEEKYKTIKAREEDSIHESQSERGALDVQRIDFLLDPNPALDLAKVKNSYPLRENNVEAESSPDRRTVMEPPSAQMRNLHFNDISALQDDSMVGLEDKESPVRIGFGQGLETNNQIFDNGDGYGRTRFKEEDEGLDLLKDIRKKQNDNLTKKKKDGEGQEDEAATAGGETTQEGDEKNEDEKFLDEDTGSVASSTKSLMKHLRMLRNALYENYSPPSIQNLKIFAKLMIIVLLIITIVQYVYSRTIYQQLKDNIVNIHSSNTRMNSLTEIGADVRILTMIAQGRVNKTRGGIDYESFKRQSLLDSSVLIQQSQNNLSNTYLRDYFTDDDNNLINPSLIQLIYNMPAAMDQFYYVDIWTSVMSVTVHALNVKEMALSAMTMDQTSIFFILVNSLNNILASIVDSTDTLLSETHSIASQVDSVMKIILYVASGSLVLAICLIFPVATKVDKNKDELLRHFMLIDREDVKKQLEKCRVFFNTMHDKEHVTQQNIDEIDDEEIKDEDKDGAEEDPSNPDKQRKVRQRSRKNKMHKKFSTNFISLIVKFLVVVTVLEGYFILCYLESGKFLNIANSIINESGTITTRQFSNNFLYQIMQEVLTTNGGAQIMNSDSLTYVFGYLNDTIKQQEAFLKEHAANSDYHDDDYNNFFNQLIYNNVCDALYQDPSSNYTNCGAFMGGILQKGLYSANVAYWDNMRSMVTDFNNSARDVPSINTILNSDRLIQNENLKDTYFTTAYTQLLSQLDSSIYYNFDSKDKEDTILFAVYMVILFLLYFILWRKFIEATRHSLWVTKSMLAIIPLEIIQKVPKIKDFLLASSKTSVSAFRD